MQLLLGTWKSLVKGPKYTCPEGASIPLLMGVLTLSSVCAPVWLTQGMQELAG